MRAFAVLMLRMLKRAPAGLYLCEYSFYASLATAQLRKPDDPTPVQFIHIPPCVAVSFNFWTRC